jgi:hypothetical protein
VYVRNNRNVTIICRDHGPFLQRPANHLEGQGCPRCGKTKQVSGQTKTLHQFIMQAQALHGDRYTYNRVKYSLSHTKVLITCGLHGSFAQTPDSHLSGRGCPACARSTRAEVQRSNTKEFLGKATLKHGEKYDYRYVTYTDARSRVTIFCPKHGVFRQTPTRHLTGSGCPRCSESKGETIVRKVLMDIGVNFAQEYRIRACRFKKPLPFDFAVIDDRRVLGLVEYHGRQHYEVARFSRVSNEKAAQNLAVRRWMDAIKSAYCVENKIPLLVIPYWCKDCIGQLVRDFIRRISTPNSDLSYPEFPLDTA